MDSIVETGIYEYHFENRGENIMTKDKLLAIGDKYEAEDRRRPGGRCGLSLADCGLCASLAEKGGSAANERKYTQIYAND